MARGDGFSAAQSYEIDRAIRSAETISRAEFSVYVGAVDGPLDAHARGLHSALTTPALSVLVAIDPAARQIAVVTGTTVRHRLSDDAVALAVVAMESAFAMGDLVGGITRGLAQLAEAARAPETLHV